MKHQLPRPEMLKVRDLSPRHSKLDIVGLQRLERLAAPLEPDRTQRTAWARMVMAHAEDFLASVPDVPAFQAVKGGGKAILSGPLPEDGEELGPLLNLLSEHVEKPGVKLGAPGYLAFIPISSLYPAALGDYLAAVTNPFAGNFFASPGAVRIENQLTRWMAEFVGYPKKAAGDLTSGGSLANLGAIVSAREAHELRARDYNRAVVYLTSQTHHSITKALRIAGLGDCVQRWIPVDRAYRMNVEALKQRIRKDKEKGLFPWLIVAAAGSTDTGAVDPLNHLAEVAREGSLWLHVDGAYGAMFALCEPGKKVLTGMERSDSLTLDPHKGLFMPCGSGAVLVRDGRYLRDAYHYDANYMRDRKALAPHEDISPSEVSAELTRPFRGLRLWLSLKLIGLRPFRAALEEKLLLARYFHEQVQRIKGIEVGAPPDLSIVAFRALPKRGDPDEYNQRLLKSIVRDGRIFITSTRLDGRIWLRMAILCATTHREHIDSALDILRTHIGRA